MIEYNNILRDSTDYVRLKVEILQAFGRIVLCQRNQPEMTEDTKDSME